MKIIIVGASGRIGSKVEDVLSERHEIVRVGEHSGDVQCDYTDPMSVEKMFEAIGGFDSLISVMGEDSVFKAFRDLDDDDYRYGFERKFLGQIRFLKVGERYLRDYGSFVFTSGFLSHHPNPSSIATGTLNAAIDNFVRNAYKLLPRGIRVNAVSPAPIVEPDQVELGLVTATQTADAYVEAVEGTMTGQVLRVWGGLPVPS